MPFKDTNLVRKFAQHIAKKLSQPPLREKLLDADLGFEHRAVGEDLRKYLSEFLKAQAAESVLPSSEVDWEGDQRNASELKRNYQIVGIWTFPDAAVLAPFTCAFEFDREPKGGGSGFKDALMKAAVHVLSGAYDACVLVYLLSAGHATHKYLNDGSDHTEQLILALQTAGLYVTLIGNQSA